MTIGISLLSRWSRDVHELVLREHLKDPTFGRMETSSWRWGLHNGLNEVTTPPVCSLGLPKRRPRGGGGLFSFLVLPFYFFTLFLSVVRKGKMYRSETHRIALLLLHLFTLFHSGMRSDERYDSGRNKTKGQKVRFQNRCPGGDGLIDCWEQSRRHRTAEKSQGGNGAKKIKWVVFLSSVFCFSLCLVSSECARIVLCMCGVFIFLLLLLCPLIAHRHINEMGIFQWTQTRRETRPP